MSDSFRDIKRASGRLGFSRSSVGPWNEGKPEAEDGVCPKCKQYDVELDMNGYCRDENCRRERLVKALQEGEAMKTSEGVIVWTPGLKLRGDL
ncbi:hypothetical protein LCGC14_2615260 [marine sediment metagenome]|uniref:Uncharacterized protein n=1 Tax=marine sediment metagenome TaxID=412755 RepID=A0A0F9CFS3_9ZZZZ